MNELAAIFAGSFALALSGALMPGPLFTITITESARRGFVAGPLLMTGHAVLELALVAAILQGLGKFLELPIVLGAIGLVGGSLLIYFGIDMVRIAGRLSLSGSSEGASEGYARHPLVLGILTSLANPYWTLWWATIGLGYLIAAKRFGIMGIVCFFLGHIAADFAWYSLVSFSISRGKTFLSDRGYRGLVRACGAILLCFGGWFLYAAKDNLL
ncbi:MAG: LysE family transporter [Syntrophobacteraceae bacterium]